MLVVIKTALASDVATAPSVNKIFSNAFHHSESDEEAAFWLGTASARCSTAAYIASNLNNTISQTKGLENNDFIGGENSEFWDTLDEAAQGASLAMFKASGQSPQEASQSLRSLLYMSEQLYRKQFLETNADGLPDLKLFEADLNDCKDFFSQNYN